jgi:hypothetical protein
MSINHTTPLFGISYSSLFRLLNNLPKLVDLYNS